MFREDHRDGRKLTYKDWSDLSRTNAILEA